MMNTPTYGNYDLLHVSVQPPMEHAVVTTSQATICSPLATQVISPEHVAVSQSSVSNVKGNSSSIHAQLPSHKFH